MHSIPIGSVLLIVLVDLAIVELLSVFLGVLIARGASKPVFVCVIVGLLVPVVGPLIWMGVLAGKDTSLAGVSRTQTRGVALYAAAGLLILSALLFLGATPIPWGSVGGSIDEYSLVAESSAADTGLGLFAMVGSAAVLVVGAVAVLMFTVWRRVAIVAAMVGAVWLMITVDGLISFSAVNDLSSSIEGLSGGMAAAGVSPGGGLYVSLLASIAAVAGASVLCMLPRDRVPLVASARTAPAYVDSKPAHNSFGSSQLSPYPPYAPPAAAPTPIRDEF